VNCAALPENLLETELFGHERGAFTGAVGRKTGRFEMAEGGPIFLDEIGELSPALQSKLQRVLQERTFERVGGTQTIVGNFRVLAATNRDLEASVREKVFREDLYYRLNVVRIQIPSLRERRSYPGNVRELENMIERAVLMARGRVIMPEHFPAKTAASANGNARPLEIDLLDLPFHKSIAELEKRLIQKALRESAGNESEAANRLQVNRRLLYNKMEEHKMEE
jgi:transcriptional regulator with PAS, ATPase and Fis domain